MSVSEKPDTFEAHSNKTQAPIGDGQAVQDAVDKNRWCSGRLATANVGSWAIQVLRAGAPSWSSKDIGGGMHTLLTQR